MPDKTAIREGDIVELSGDPNLRYDFMMEHGTGTSDGPYLVRWAGLSFFDLEHPDGKMLRTHRRFLVKVEAFLDFGVRVIVPHSVVPDPKIQGQPFRIVGKGTDGAVVAVNCFDTVRIPARQVPLLRTAGVAGSTKEAP